MLRPARRRNPPTSCTARRAIKARARRPPRRIDTAGMRPAAHDVCDAPLCVGASPAASSGRLRLPPPSILGQFRPNHWLWANHVWLICCASRRPDINGWQRGAFLPAPGAGDRRRIVLRVATAGTRRVHLHSGHVYDNYLLRCRHKWFAARRLDSLALNGERPAGELGGGRACRSAAASTPADVTLPP